MFYIHMQFFRPLFSASPSVSLSLVLLLGQYNRFHSTKAIYANSYFVL
jgi:hypothetical protein